MFFEFMFKAWLTILITCAMVGSTYLCFLVVYEIYSDISSRLHSYRRKKEFRKRLQEIDHANQKMHK